MSEHGTPAFIHRIRNDGNDWGHYQDSQYAKNRADLYVQAAKLIGLSVSTVKEGKVFSKDNLKVSKGLVGVKVYFSKPEDADTYWVAVRSLEDAQKSF